MSERIKLVQGDTMPIVDIVIKDENHDTPIDLTGAQVLLKFRPVGSTTLKETITGSLLTGVLGADGVTVDTTPPYNTPGRGGRVRFTWTPTALDTVGSFEGEVEITYPDLTVQTVYDIMKFRIRPQF